MAPLIIGRPDQKGSTGRDNRFANHAPAGFFWEQPQLLLEHRSRYPSMVSPEVRSRAHEDEDDLMAWKHPTQGGTTWSRLHICNNTRRRPELYSLL
jgi:hypothetical protein